MIRVVAAVSAELGDLVGVALGIGPVRAAAAAGALLTREQPDAVILVGSAGAYPGGPPVGAVITSRRLGWADGSSTLGHAYAPLAPVPVEADAALVARLGLPVADVLTVPAITTHPPLVAALAGRDDGPWAVEHLEASVVALACAAAGVPFVAVLGIANRVGPNAHAEWLAWRERAEAAARDAVRPVVQACDGSGPSQ